MSARNGSRPMRCFFGGGLLLTFFPTAAAAIWLRMPEPPSPPKGWHKVEPRLTQFDKAADEAARKRVERVQKYLTEREQGADVFAKDVLSWGGKWELVKDVAGYGDHPRFLAETFERDVFSTADLK